MGLNWKILLAVIGLLLVVIYSSNKIGYGEGKRVVEERVKIEIAELNEEARAKEQQLLAEQAERDKKQYEEFKDAQDTITQLRADVASGRRRLSVAINKASVCASENAASTGLDNGTARAELDHEAADRIIRIVADGDRAIRQLNALQDWAEEVMDFSQ